MMPESHFRRRCAVLLCVAVAAAGTGRIADCQPVLDQPVPADTSLSIDSLAQDAASDHPDSAGNPVPREWIPVAIPNSVEEVYLRYLQIAGLVKMYPWSIRGFSAGELRSLSAATGSHPWSGTRRFTSQPRFAHVVPITSELRHNSGFPYGSNDRAVWAGRGFTASASGGLLATAGPIQLSLAPLVFVAQNTSFPLMDNGAEGYLRFADGRAPEMIDRPQRFGDAAYGEVDPGHSSARLVLGPFQAGGGTENRAWGPSEEYPFTIGTNAAGFPHAFIGTSRPANLLVARMHAQMIWGLLEQSSYSPVTGSRAFQSLAEPGTRRFASGLALLLEPRGISGLEVGVARFMHSAWPADGLSWDYFRKPWNRLFKNRIPPVQELGRDRDYDNQLISAFARWLFPAARFEIYGEYGREDHAWDFRDLVQEPDHMRAYGLGLRHVLRANPDRLDGITIELINYQLPTLARTGRGAGQIYIHDILRQGHTNRGQLLGADVGILAAAGLSMRWDSYHHTGRTAITARRVVRQQRGDFYLTGETEPSPSDVLYVLQLERARRLGWIEVTAGTALMRNLGRDFSGGAWNASTFLRTQVLLRAPR